LPDFKLVNQDANTVNWENYKGKIVLVNLFYTKGENYAVTFANRAMRGFAKTYERNTMVHFIGITIDPINDQPDVLSLYAKEQLQHLPKWDLLTGDTTQVQAFIKMGLLLDAIQTIENGRPRFTFSNMFVLLDSKHRIRGYYEATNQEALSKLDDEIKVLIAEELRNMRDGR